MSRSEPSAAWWKRSIANGDVTFLVGAGISADPPSSLPLAGGLTRHLLAPVFCAANLPTALARRCEGVATGLRPEVAAELLVAHLGLDGLRPLTHVLSGEPNAWHHLFAEALGAGCTVITTNFDTLIEQACSASKVAYRRVTSRGRSIGASSVGRGAPTGTLIKVHGTLFRHRTSVGSQLSNLSLALRQVSRGIPGAMATHLTEALRDRPLITLGYAGRDDFDIRVYLGRLPRRAPTVWVVHDGGRTQLRPLAPNERRWSPAQPVIEHARDWEGPTQILRGLTSRAADLFPTAWVRAARRRQAPEVSQRKASAGWDLLDRAKSLRALAYLMLEQRAFETGLAILACGLDTISGDLRVVVRLTLDEAIVTEKRGSDLRGAARKCRKALAMARKARDPYLIAETLDQLGVLARRRGFYLKALSYYAEALGVLGMRRRRRDLEIRIRAHRAIALDYKERYARALREYAKVEDYQRRSGDLRGLVKTWNNMAIALMGLKRPIEADRHFARSLHVKRQLGDIKGVASSLHGLGRLHYFQGSSNFARRAWEECYRLRTGRARDPQGAAQTLIGLGWIAVGEGRRNDARRMAADSLRTAQEVGDDRGVREANGLLAACQPGVIRRPRGPYVDARISTSAAVL